MSGVSLTVKIFVPTVLAVQLLRSVQAAGIRTFLKFASDRSCYLRRLFENDAILEPCSTGNPENGLEIPRRPTPHLRAAEGYVAALPLRRRLGDGGKFRLIVERARQNIQQRVEGSVIIESVYGTSLLLALKIFRRLSLSNRQAHNSQTFPVLESRAMNGGALLATSRLMRGSALTNAAAISVPWSWVEVSTKAFTLAVAIAVRSVTR
jgi:hypothetical protein